MPQMPRAGAIDPALDWQFAEMVRHSREAGTLWTVFTDSKGRQLITGSERMPSREALVLAAMGMRNYVCSKDPITGYAVMEGPTFLPREKAERMIDRYLQSGTRRQTAA